MLMKIEEGYMPFLGHMSYYRIVGEPSRERPVFFAMTVSANSKKSR